MRKSQILEVKDKLGKISLYKRVFINTDQTKEECWIASIMRSIVKAINEDMAGLKVQGLFLTRCI